MAAETLHAGLPGTPEIVLEDAGVAEQTDSTAQDRPALRKGSSFCNKRSDTRAWLSAVPEQTRDEEPQKLHEPPDKLPIALLIFVAGLALVAGFIVTGTHKAIVYSGCPLGINGCNEFYGKEEKAYWLQKAFPDLPEEVLFIIAGTCGSALIGTILHFLSPAVRGQVLGGGTVQSLVAVASGNVIPLKAVPLKLLVSCLFLGTGGTLGGEGPTIQITTAIIGQLGWLVGIRAVETQSLLAMLGFSCGFAASFNAPLAGVLFAAEEMDHLSKRLSKALVLMLLVASIMSTLVVRAAQSNTPLFEVRFSDGIFDAVKGGSAEHILGRHMWMLIAVPIGILCALVSALMCRFLRLSHDFMNRHGQKIPAPLMWATLGFTVASLGAIVFSATGLRGVWGIGIGGFQNALALSDEIEVSAYLLLGVAKLLALVLSVTLQGPGDMLEPTLIGGGCLGAVVGKALPAEYLGANTVQVCTILGMSGLFASSFGFPLTPVVFTLELTGVQTYSLIIPVALCSLTAMKLTQRLHGELLHEVMAQEGIDLHAISHAASHPPDSPRSSNSSEPGHCWGDSSATEPSPAEQLARMDDTRSSSPCPGDKPSPAGFASPVFGSLGSRRHSVQGAMGAIGHSFMCALSDNLAEFARTITPSSDHHLQP
eukprot:TRINITY_DN31680_c0_g2_i1.p1 TRINITY_DN31680_c0_g2~~TRINITY_DN31680_c0_g2_i1.p1  ORF type:complete len:652 (-),score=88.79 TRINITY_DN31680_c0_g2_i1:113-2068(-)